MSTEYNIKEYKIENFSNIRKATLKAPILYTLIGLIILFFSYKMGYFIVGLGYLFGGIIFSLVETTQRQGWWIDRLIEKNFMLENEIKKFQSD